MCGIVGYLGAQDALPILMSGLEKLEYRGYDSAGIALYEGGSVKVTRTLGKLSELKRAFADKTRSIEAHLGIGHTRWATHGKPSLNNAHPHTAGRISLIHNGIIENHSELRRQLVKSGCNFLSETDTEIVAQLLNQHLQHGKTPFEALKATCSEIRGSYAFVAIDSENPDRLLVAKNATPIVVGLAKGEILVSSDISAILNRTRDIIELEDGDIADLRIDSVFIENDHKQVRRESKNITWSSSASQKSGFKHFMLKEIHQQPEVVADSLRGRIDPGSGSIILEEINFTQAELQALKRVVLVACGTAWHAALLAKFYIEKFAELPCEVDYASEFRYRSPVLDGDTLVVAVSQSGETADTLGALDLASSRAKIAAVCNVLGSSLARRCENTIFTHAGPEISVASTKAFSTQVITLSLLAIYLGQQRGKLKADDQLVRSLLQLPSAMRQVLLAEGKVVEVAKRYSTARDFLYVGRGISYPIALEGALKLKEISYIHAEGYPAGEMKHGPIALIDENMPVVVVIPRSDILFEKTMSNLHELASRGAQIIAVTDIVDHNELAPICKDVIQVPFVHEYLSPLLMNLPLQLLAYNIAVMRGADIDQPRNLAKSVTVE